MTSTATAKGTVIKNIQRHDTVSMRKPPSSGPSAEVSADAPDHSPMAPPRSPAGNAALIIAKLPGVRSAPPTPCTARAAMSCPTLGASPHHTEAAVKTTTPTKNTRLRPKRSPSEPPVRISAAKKSV